MPEELLVLGVRYIAIFGLVVALALIFVRWRFPLKEVKSGGPGSGSGSSDGAKGPSVWQLLWHMYRKSKRLEKARGADLRAVRGKRVLVVDPDEKSAKVLIWRLEQLGCKVKKARTGAQALAMVHAAPRPSTELRMLRSAGSVDVVISDALLPDISAVDFCDALGPGVPVVLVGVLDARREELARFGGRVECLGKPYDPEDAAALAGRAFSISNLQFSVSD